MNKGNNMKAICAQKAKERIGMSTTANCQMKMTIIDYRGSDDIDVKFEDGTVVQHKTFHGFRSGKIQNPNLPRLCGKGSPKFQEQHRAKCIGAVAYNNANLRMVVKEYNGSDDVIVEFDDGKTAHTTYYHFKNGNVRHPDVYITRNITEKTSEHGEKIKVLQYVNCEKILIEFENGEQRWVAGQTLIKGQLRSRENLCQTHVGEKSVDTQGNPTELIEWSTNSNITVRFHDGSVRTGLTYHAFKDGKVAHPSVMRNFPSKENLRIGETNKANNGQMMTIVAYRRNSDLDVRFEDGTVVQHKAYHQFKNGGIRNPNCK